MLSYDSPMKGQQPPSAHLSPTLQAVTGPMSASQAPAATLGKSAVAGYDLKHHHIWLVTGPAGCGKSTVAEYIADALEMPYIEGDSFHTAVNVEKMRTGSPLTDTDRWDWLTALREESMHRIDGGSEGVVVTCSALKRKYRDVIRVAAYYDHQLLIHFIYLDASEEVLMQRVTKRQGHYMGADMVHSQFDILERPSEDEKDVISIDVSRSLEEVKQDALARTLDVMNSDHSES